MSFQKTTWHVSGMHCVHCESAVVRAVSGLEGLREPRADYARSTLTAFWDADALPLETIRARLQAEGYDLSEKAGTLREAARLIVSLLLCAALYLLATHTPAARWLNSFPTVKAGMSLTAVFLVGLMTSVHCIAMCGGIALTESSLSAKKRRSVTRGCLLYNLGRVISYTLVGCAAGALGSVFSLSSAVKAAIQLVAAVFMIVMALNLSGAFSILQRFSIRLPDSWRTRLLSGKRGSSSLLIGLANGLMPCGPLQSMQLYALSTGSPVMGGLSMAAFSLGTVPLMLGFGLLGGRLNQRFRRPMHIFSAALILLMGFNMLSSGLALAGTAPAAVEIETDAVAELSPDGSFQTVTTELEWTGYPSFTVQAGVPVRWTLHAQEDKLIGCNWEILIPAFDMDIPLTVGDNLITFTPQEPGVIPFSCWMGMLRSQIVVVDRLP